MSGKREIRCWAHEVVESDCPVCQSERKSMTPRKEGSGIVERLTEAARPWYAPDPETGAMPYPILSVGADRWIKQAEPLLTEAATHIEAQDAEIKVLREALEPFAAKQTIEEALADPTPPAWAFKTPEERVQMMGERKRENDANILRARLALSRAKDRSAKR